MWLQQIAFTQCGSTIRANSMSTLQRCWLIFPHKILVLSSCIWRKPNNQFKHNTVKQSCCTAAHYVFMHGISMTNTRFAFKPSTGRRSGHGMCRSNFKCLYLINLSHRDRSLVPLALKKLVINIPFLPRETQGNYKLLLTLAVLEIDFLFIPGSWEG